MFKRLLQILTLVSLSFACFAYAEVCESILVKDVAVTLRSHELDAANLANAVSAAFKYRTKASELAAEKVTKASFEILVHAFLNTIQHGHVYFQGPVIQAVNDLRLEVPVHLELFQDEQYIYAMIVNPQIKTFPEILLQEFTYGRHLNIPLNQRVGYRGSGVAHHLMIDELKHLPTGSSVRWQNINAQILFTLKIRVN